MNEDRGERERVGGQKVAVWVTNNTIILFCAILLVHCYSNIIYLCLCSL